MTHGIRTIFYEETQYTCSKYFSMQAFSVSFITLKKFANNYRKKINLALKATFYRKRFDSTKELKREHSVIPISLFLEKKILFFLKIKQRLLPYFDILLGQ